MYGLYHAQLAISPVSIRLALKDWCHVENFLKDSINSSHYDVVYIYKKLVAKKAIHYTAMPNLLFFRRHKSPTSEPMCPEFIGRSTVVQDLLSADILEEMTNIQNHYEKMKVSMPEIHAKASMTHREFVTNLKDCMSGFIVWQNKTFSQDKSKKQDDVEEKSMECPSSRATLLSSIKQKSYGNYQEVSKARRHRPVEVVSESTSGGEEGRGARSKHKRPPSLFRRTQRKLGKGDNKKQFNPWLLTIPENLPEDRALKPMQIIL